MLISRYEIDNEMLILAEGKVAWIFLDGYKHYWRDHIEK